LSAASINENAPTAISIAMMLRVFPLLVMPGACAAWR